MARCDYHGCAVCDGKAFYNANMSLDDEGGYWGCEVVALCRECVKTHQIVVQPRADKGDGWIDCKQELPPTLVEVLVGEESMPIRMMSFVERLADGDVIWMTTDGRFQSWPTHWQPLPAPPKP